MRCVLYILLFLSTLTTAQELGDSLDDMNLEDLIKLKIDSSASLTGTDRRRTPASITRITSEMIQRSGARSLEEVLEIFVPNFQTLRHHFAGTNKGFRGVLTDQDDKILLLVNGRVMNHRTFYGADSEFKLSMLGDIHHIDVVRGPGSATYGPGAISGVISIQTFNSKNFTGTEVRVRQGFIEEFSSFEMKMGRTFNDDTGLFVYWGGDLYQGADHKNAPVYFGTSVNGAEPYRNPGINFNDDKESFRGRPRMKLHVEYNVANLDFWIRYTSGGERYTGIREFTGVSLEDEFAGIGYEQWTAALRYRKELTNDLKLEIMASYDVYDRYRTFRTDTTVSDLNLREEKANFRLQMNWNPAPAHELAFGTEFSWDQFGREPDGFPEEDAKPVPGNSPWDSHTWALFAEHQWRLSGDLTSFTGIRADKHSYSEMTFSPRQAFVYTPTAEDTFKLIYNRSIRRTSDFFLRTEYLATHDESDETETLDNYEFRYERELDESWTMGLSAYYSFLDIIAFDGNSNTNRSLGDLSWYGFEFETEYKTEKMRLLFSHGWSKMKDFDLGDPTVTIQGISASPYGYGNNLAHWSNHISKLYAEYYLTSKWTVNSSMVYYWGYPGAEDYADYNNQVLKKDNLTRTNGSKKAFGSSIFMNAGIEYKPDENWRFQLNAHNILGWLDKDCNKRNYLLLSDTYTAEAAAVSFTVQYRF